MTDSEQEIKDVLINVVLAPKHPVFAEALIDYDLHFTDDPRVTARMFPAKALIELNINLDDPDVISCLIRHELAHFILQHEKNGIKWLAGKYGINTKHMKKSEYKWLKQKLYTETFVPGISVFDDTDVRKRSGGYGLVTAMNVASDWHLSGIVYDSDDEKIQMNLGGLILQLDHPEMKDMTYFQILDEVYKWVREYNRKAMQIIYGNMQEDGTFIPDEVEEKEESIV